ncbi:MAG: hypothetical protein ABR987_21495 [Terracidiphilus sp.]|jgi:hypothetical protein
MAIRIVRLVGIVVFVVAFFLPAVRDAHTPSGPGSLPMSGWMCATVAISASAGILHLVSGTMQGKDLLGACCLILSGWVNPLVILYLFFCIWKKFVLIRRVLAVAILICVVATWVFFVKAPMVPLIGHFVWVAGALMILFGEVAGMVSTKKTKEL